MTQNLNWQPLKNKDELAITAAKRIAAAAKQAIAERGCFKLVLAGGSTPENAYRLLIDLETDWQHWQVYYGDERCLPADHPDRNSKMATDVFLQYTSIPNAQIHPMPTELGGEQAARDYQAIVKQALPFDLVLLGMGEDGHTASLFPGHEHDEHALVHAVYEAPKPPAERVSLSAKALSESRAVLFLISAANKQQALEAWQRGDNLPVALIQPKTSVTVLLAD
ncbi:MAG: 6-phosphogluconolactonase [Methylococcales bacterium]|nr:6-phosphogluconolactonase [Methylococcales bacterium]